MAMNSTERMAVLFFSSYSLLFFLFFCCCPASVKPGFKSRTPTWTPADVHAAAVDSCVFIRNDKLCFLLDFQVDLSSTAARITVPGVLQH